MPSQKQPIRPQLAADIAESQPTDYPQSFVRQTRLDVDNLFDPDYGNDNRL